MKLMDYVGQVLDLYNYYSGAIMINRAGIIEYYYNSRKDINTLTEKDVVGKSLFDIYPGTTYENSTLIEVMRTGEAKTNTYQSLINYKCETYGALCDTIPVFDNKIIIGAIEVFIYMEERDKYMNIFIADRKVYPINSLNTLDNIISVSDKMKTLKEKILKVASTKSTVLIYGETGTGKELIVNAIHNSGARSSKRFISQNCAAIPENLLESILFGTVKGSFTGAENRMGLFEVANGGTLFLDEINSMDKVVQAKILKAIEEQCIMRVGGTDDIPIDVRVIAATNIEPMKCVTDGLLREDLYYRLKVVELVIPPLRSRKNDIEPLIEHYIKFYNRTMGKSIRGASNEVRKLLYNHFWPGNVRELRNIIEGAFNLCDSENIGLEDLDIYALEQINESNVKAYDVISNGNLTLRDKVRSYEKKLIIRAIKENDNLIKTSKKLGVTRQTLNNKIKDLRISEEELKKH